MSNGRLAFIREALIDSVPDATAFLGSHCHASWAKACLEAEWSSYYKFAFVRNPWERILSWYMMIMQTQQGEMPPWYRDILDGRSRNKLWDYVFQHSTNFEEFVRNCTDIIDDIDGRKSFAYNQLDYLVDEQGNLLVDFIGRYENYAHDAQRVFQQLGLQHVVLPHVWPSQHQDYRSYYTTETKNIIAERFARDIEFFGYTFERNS